MRQETPSTRLSPTEWTMSRDRRLVCPLSCVSIRSRLHFLSVVDDIDCPVVRNTCADMPILISPNRHNGRLANSKEFWRRIFYAHTNGVTGCEMYPVERSLHIRQALVQLSDDIGIRGDSKTDAVHDARESNIRLG